MRLVVSLCFGLLFCTTQSLGSESRRGQVIDFEEGIVEGVHQQPLDSVSQISEKNKKQERAHLYFKRGGFRSEIKDSLRHIRLSP